jgi:phytoene dehydrogenase-like protein
MVVEGGMGVVTQQLATKAMAAGAAIHTASPVERVEVQGGQATGAARLTLSKGAPGGVV